LQARLDVLYEDRLDRRIDTLMYDAKSGEIRQQLDSIRNRLCLFDGRWPEGSEKLSGGSAPILIESGWQTF
jgi:hypothetical protein